MKIKNVVYFIIVFIIFFANAQNSFAALPKVNTETEITLDEDDKTYSEAEIIKRISLKNKFQKTPQAQIEAFIKKYNKYSEKNNLEKLKNLYSKDFVNNDGFDRDTVFEMMKLASGAYKDIKYTTDIKEIKVNGNYATVKAHESASAKCDKLSKHIEEEGTIVSEIDYVDYLVKEGNDWKLQVSEILTEEISMKYGEAKNMNIEIISPVCVSEGASYEASLHADVPDGSFAVGSIVNEKIVFPQEESKDVFRAIKSGKLSRVLHANEDNKNEYVTVSIALTRAEIEPPAVNINMTGAAFAMKRVNVVSFNKKKEDLNAEGQQK